MCPYNYDAGLGSSESYVIQPRFELLHTLLSLLEIEEEEVEGALREKALVGGVVLLLPTEIPDTKVKDLSSQCWPVLPLTDVHTDRGLIPAVSALESCHESRLASVGAADKHQLYAVEALGTPKLAVQVAYAVACVALHIAWWVVQVLEVPQMKSVETAQPAHLCGEREDIGVIGEVQGVQGREATHAEWDAAELIEGKVEVSYGTGNGVERESGKLIVGEL